MSHSSGGGAAGPAAEDFGGQTLPNGIRLHGWRFESSEGPIASSGELKQLRARLQEGAKTDENLPKLPEAIFLKNTLVVAHEASGARLSFDAEGALLHWLRNSLVHGAGGLTVPAAHLGSWKEKVLEQAQQTGDAGRRDWDWTYSTEYAGLGADAGGRPLAWSAHRGGGIDMALLRRREPILFFADLPLYQDDLHDNGASEARLRIRVMPSCFFVLLRHWLRVDGMLIRQHDARFFTRFATAAVPPGAGGGGAGESQPPPPPPPLIRLLRRGAAPLPPLPAAPPESELGGRLVEGGAEDTPRPPFVRRADLLPDEQASADMLAELTAEVEVEEELPLTAQGVAEGVAALDVSGT